MSENEIRWLYCKKIIDSMKEDGLLSETEWYWMILRLRTALGLKVI